jgi:hypothetical protein
MVSLMQTTPREKRKLHIQTPEIQGRKETKAVDMGIYVDLSRLWDKM